MHLLLVTGFLGSGKTTFIINLTKQVIASGMKPAILVNEIGEIGIDDQMMRQLDLDVWEMMGGCICCTLSADLVDTLQMLDEQYEVDLVIVEPSGAAEPGNILAALPYYKGDPLESIKSVSILDPLRIVEMYAVLTPLITNQVAKAAWVVLNKADVATDEELHNAAEIAKEINPTGQLVTLSAKGVLPDDFMKAILPDKGEVQGH